MNNDKNYDKSIQELEKELHQVKLQFRFAAGSAIAILIVGMTFYYYVEHFSLVNDFYFCVITLATVGYGDIVPKTDPGKIFTVFYVLSGIGIIAGFANAFLRRSMAASELRRAHRNNNSKQ